MRKLNASPLVGDDLIDTGSGDKQKFEREKSEAANDARYEGERRVA